MVRSHDDARRSPAPWRVLVDAWNGPARSSLVERGLVRGAMVGGAIGALTGLVLGLIAYPPTAWAATVEVGAPGAILGGLLGVLAALAMMARRHLGRDDRGHPPAASR